MNLMLFVIICLFVVTYISVFITPLGSRTTMIKAKERNKNWSCIIRVKVDDKNRKTTVKCLWEQRPI